MTKQDWFIGHVGELVRLGFMVPSGMREVVGRIAEASETIVSIAPHDASPGDETRTLHLAYEGVRYFQNCSLHVDASEEEAAFTESRWADKTLRDITREAEGRHIRRILEHTKGHRANAAQLLGISRKNLWEKMREHGLMDGPEDGF